eukprot:TRINITY_DN3188_c0_g1_i14.p2 TRINITY_DN3188_c0_g1~~TRINITY_DN3188_c0_g1_i14.p2  ORF type:complete len:225 (-),score=59.21 TRINITY_DN3188_c0_g1_i14:586-1191(-)
MVAPDEEARLLPTEEDWRPVVPILLGQTLLVVLTQPADSSAQWSTAWTAEPVRGRKWLCVPTERTLLRASAPPAKPLALLLAAAVVTAAAPRVRPALYGDRVMLWHRASQSYVAVKGSGELELEEFDLAGSGAAPSAEDRGRVFLIKGKPPGTPLLSKDRFALESTMVVHNFVAVDAVGRVVVVAGAEPSPNLVAFAGDQQ